MFLFQFKYNVRRKALHLHHPIRTNNNFKIRTKMAYVISDDCIGRNKKEAVSNHTETASFRCYAN